MHLHSKRKCIRSRGINTLWWAFGGEGKTETLITLWSFVCNWQVTLAFMFAARHVHHLRCLHTGNLKGELLWCHSFCSLSAFFLVWSHSLCSIIFPTYVITCQASGFCVLLTLTLSKHLFLQFYQGIKRWWQLPQMAPYWELDRTWSPRWKWLYEAGF